MVVAFKSQQNRAKTSDTYSQSFIWQVNIGLIFMLHATALVTFSLKLLILQQDTSTRTVRLYIRGIQLIIFFPTIF